MIDGEIRDRPLRVLVTGGAGFIGSHVVDRHLAAGDEVVVIDDLSTGSRDNLPHDAGPRLTVFEGRVEAPGILDRAFDRIDLVYHLAAAVGVFEILRRPLDSLRTNLDASEAVFERASREGVRTIFTSTSEVYGKNGKAPLSETDDSIYGPTTAHRWLYAVSKATDEFLALAHHRERGFPVTIVRLFNTTGPRQTGAYGMVVPRFVGQAMRGEPLTVYGSGSQTRCFTNVRDVVECLVRLGRTDAAIGVVVNIGRPIEITMNDLAELVRTVVGSTSPIVHLPYDKAYAPGFEDMRRRVPDVRRLGELIGFVPDTPLEATIREIIAWTDAGDDTPPAAVGAALGASRVRIKG
jgi:UDP-glucose 4-epimerase